MENLNKGEMERIRIQKKIGGQKNRQNSREHSRTAQHVCYFSLYPSENKNLKFKMMSLKM